MSAARVARFASSDYRRLRLHVAASANLHRPRGLRGVPVLDRKKSDVVMKSSLDSRIEALKKIAEKLAEPVDLADLQEQMAALCKVLLDELEASQR